jgi:hypothetical protein
MADEILIPGYDTLAAMLERNTRERQGIQALLRMRVREPEERSNEPLRIPIASANRDIASLLTKAGV